MYILGPSRVGNSLIKFRSFALLIFGERPEWFAHDLSFLLSDLSESLIIAHLSCATWAIRSLRSEEMSESFASLKKFKKMLKTYTKYNLLNFFEGIAHLLWAKEKWAICSKKPSNSLICPERPEGNAHICSFVMSDLSDSLTVAHLSWAIWANDRIPNPDSHAPVHTSSSYTVLPEILRFSRGRGGGESYVFYRIQILDPAQFLKSFKWNKE